MIMHAEKNSRLDETELATHHRAKEEMLVSSCQGCRLTAESRKEKTKPVSDVKARESSVRDIQLFLEIWQVQNKPRGNTCHLFRQL